MDWQHQVFRQAIERDLDSLARHLRVSMALNFVCLLLSIGAIYLALKGQP